MVKIEQRIATLEQKAATLSGTEMMLNALRAIGFDGVCVMFAEDDESNGRAQMPFWTLMNIMDDHNTTFEFERYRGFVHDEVIRLAYSDRRNWAYGNEAIVTRVRQLAGVIDVGGNIMPGYLLLDNGCIVDAT